MQDSTHCASNPCLYNVHTHQLNELHFCQNKLDFGYTATAKWRTAPEWSACVSVGGHFFLASGQPQMCLASAQGVVYVMCSWKKKHPKRPKMFRMCLVLLPARQWVFLKWLPSVHVQINTARTFPQTLLVLPGCAG